MKNYISKLKSIYSNYGFGRGSKKLFEILNGKFTTPFVLSSKERIINSSDQEFIAQDSKKLKISYEGCQAENLPKRLKNYIGEINVPPKRVLEFHNVKLIGKYGVIITDENKYIAPSSVDVDKRYKIYFRNMGFELLVNYFNKPNYEIKSGFLLNDTFRGQFFPKWFTENLIKLRFLKNVRGKIDYNFKILVPETLKSYQREIFDAMGFNSNDIIELKDYNYSVDKLLLASHPLKTGGGKYLNLKDELIWVRDKILNNLNFERKFPKKIYISRETADRRKVLNEGKIVEELAEFGFKCFEPGRLTKMEQINLFSGADFIIGPHGTNLDNIMFCSEGTRIIELFPGEKGVKEMFFIRANNLNLEYEFFVAKPVNSKCKRPINRNMIVDCKDLSLLVRNMQKN